MRIIQITDSHISLDTPQRTRDLELCVEHVNAVHPVADLVIHTGDIVHGGQPEEYRIAKELLDTLKAPYIVLAGNKDQRQELSRAFPYNRNLQKASEDQNYDLVDDGEFIQFSLEQFPFRLIVLDTAGVASKGEFCKKRLQHLDEMLAADLARPVVVFMHHAPVEIGEIPDPFQFEDWSEVDALNATFSKYQQVESIYCGHIHRNIESTLGRLPVSVLTCTACDLRKGQLSEADRLRPMINVIDLPDN